MDSARNVRNCPSGVQLEFGEVCVDLGFVWVPVCVPVGFPPHTRCLVDIGRGTGVTGLSGMGCVKCGGAPFPCSAFLICFALCCITLVTAIAVGAAIMHGTLQPVTVASAVGVAMGHGSDPTGRVW